MTQLADAVVTADEQLVTAVQIRGTPEVTSIDTLMKRFAPGDTGHVRTYATMSPEGDYALLGLVGEGSMGQILIAKDHDLKRKVAFKQMSEAYAHEEGLLQRFLAEDG